MDFTSNYLSKHDFKPEILADPHPDLNLCVVIPCYNESGLLRSLRSLWECERTSLPAEILVVVNAPENSDPQVVMRNEATVDDLDAWILTHQDEKLSFHRIYRPNLASKFAGVGWARKIGMDEAAYRLSRVGNTRGIIAGFDADSVCDPNYLVAMEQHFHDHPKTPGASLYFEHPISGSEFGQDIYNGIILYELHLRYLNQALRYAGHPHAWHTVGSSFAVRMDAYVKQGGMNRRQAGEDFYFLQKIISLGNFSEINSTRVIPSPRESDRVPFGTGASMKRWQTDKEMKTYNLQAYQDVKALIALVGSLYHASPETIVHGLKSLSEPLQAYLLDNKFYFELHQVQENCATLPAFRNRFFGWMNAFRVIKYLNFVHEQSYARCEIVQEATKLLTALGYDSLPTDDKGLLDVYRRLDRGLLTSL